MTYRIVPAEATPEMLMAARVGGCVKDSLGNAIRAGALPLRTVPGAREAVMEWLQEQYGVSVPEASGDAGDLLDLLDALLAQP